MLILSPIFAADIASKSALKSIMKSESALTARRTFCGDFFVSTATAESKAVFIMHTAAIS